MKVLKSKDNSFNFIHDNGMQTSIKLAPSGSFTSNNVEDRDAPMLVDKNKYTVIISSSKGCQMACSFCELTKKSKEFTKSSALEISRNVTEALNYVKSEFPNICDKYVKLCFQGEGEALLDMRQTSIVTDILTDLFVSDTSYCRGFDGVDIATCIPKISSSFIYKIEELNQLVLSKALRLNPYNYANKVRSLVRVFYSLHHYKEQSRNLLIPRTRSIRWAINHMTQLNSLGINIVIHYMFMQGVNDSKEDVDGLIDMINSDTRFKDFEFRVLRYNGSSSEDKESDNIVDIIKTLEDKVYNVKKLKIQYSSGEEIKAACGMFI